MKTIPELREELLNMANDLRVEGASYQAGKLKRIVKQLYRRKSVRKAAIESAKFTPELKAQVITYANNHPHVSYIKIANRYNISTGRVSEALAGKRAA